MKQQNAVFIVWKKFQRRVEVLAPLMGLDIYYFYYSWEEKSIIFKVLSYVPKSIGTFKCLYRKNPSLVFVQFPPTPALYCVALYAWLTGAMYITDCHISVANEHWLKWIYAKKLLVKGGILVHNDFLIGNVVRSLHTRPFVLRDGITTRRSAGIGKTSLIEHLGLSSKSYLIIPCSFSADEPINEMIQAAKLLPEIKFVLTWNFEKLSPALRTNLPSNIVLTGYLQVADFDNLFAHAGVALVLTKYEELQLSGMQEAMAFEIPAIVSDLKTTRNLYKQYPVYVRNDPRSIAEGIKYAFQNRAALQEKMKCLRIETEQEFFVQLASLKSVLNSRDVTGTHHRAMINPRS